MPGNRLGYIFGQMNHPIEHQLTTMLGQWHPGTHKPLVDRVMTKYEQEDARLKAEEIQRQLSLLRQQHDRLLNLRLMGEIDERTMAEKAMELRDREANFKLQLDACDLGRHENGEIAVKAFEFSHNLRAKWLTAEYVVKRRYLEIVFLNFILDEVTLVPTTRKPFDILAEGLLVSSSRADRI
jgi:site-specific DNA recombinase